MNDVQKVFNEICEFSDRFKKELGNSDTTFIVHTSVELCDKIEMELNFFSLTELNELREMIFDRVKENGSTLIMRVFHESVNGRIQAREESERERRR